jgi:hypothetical protein
MQRMRAATRVWSAIALILAVAAAPAVLHGQVPHPADVFGFEPGEDYKLADHGQLIDYYQRLAAASDRVEIREIGRSTQGRPMVVLFISSPDNLARLDHYRTISERLARAQDLTDTEARRLSREGKAVVWIDAGLHSTEVAHSQMAPLLAHHMATDETSETERFRQDVILLLMPGMNPDGHDIVVDWYRQNLGTDFETTSPPNVYHEYIGHDINRDWFMITQEETKHVSRVLYERVVPADHLQPPPDRAVPRAHLHPAVRRSREPAHPAAGGAGREHGGRAHGEAPRGGGHARRRLAHDVHHVVERRHAHGAVLQEHGGPAVRGRPRLADAALPPSRQPARVLRHRQPPHLGARGQRLLRQPVAGRLGPARRRREYHLVSSLGALDIASRLREDWLFNIYRMGRDAIARPAPRADPTPTSSPWIPCSGTPARP